MSATNAEYVQLPISECPEVAFPLDSHAFEAEWIKDMESLGGDAPSRGVGDDYLMDAGALYHGGPIQWSFVPKIFSSRDLGYLAWIAQTMGRIMVKVTDAFSRDAALRRKFGFSEDLDQLIMAPCPYASVIPIARVDIFLNELTGDFQFCELNTDGSSGMLATMEVGRANLLTETGRLFSSSHTISSFDIYSECTNAVLRCYRDAGGTSPNPVVAAVDYSESISCHEIEKYRSCFERMGATLRFSDIRDLKYTDGSLRDSHGKIDLVWRRVVVSEMLEKPCSGADALMTCALEGGVPIVGGFRTWPCATKTVFAVLHDPVIEPYLTSEELRFARRHVPKTYMLDEGCDLSQFADKDNWIAKPRDGYNSFGVRAGSECSDSEWADVLREMAATHGTIQAYAPQYETQNVEGGRAAEGRGLLPHANMEGLFLFDGKFGGVFTRCGTSAVIGEHTGRLNMGCLVVEE